MKNICTLILLVLLTLSSGFSQAVSFTRLAQQECLSEDDVSYTIGEQYVDTANNGVPDDRWSMLTRWQGFKGHQSFVNCNGGEIAINTWQVPHRLILGGGYNDMFGYSWNLSSAPSAFMDSPFRESDLIVQAYVTVPRLITHLGNHQRQVGPVVNITLFAYIIDITHPNLHPIAVIGLSHSNFVTDYPGFIGADYPDGVWFSSFPLHRETRWNTLDPFGHETVNIGNSSWQMDTEHFIRMRVSPQNWRNTIADINSSPCGACPQNGYSTDVRNYKVKYAGIIAEVSTWDNSEGTQGDKTFDQVNLGLVWKWLGIYRRVEN